jgi:hypothetical protein
MAIAKAHQSLRDILAQHLTLEIADLAVVDVDVIELPAVKMQKQRADEITQDIVRTSFVSNCIQISYHSSSGEEESGERMPCTVPPNVTTVTTQ